MRPPAGIDAVGSSSNLLDTNDSAIEGSSPI